MHILSSARVAFVWAIAASTAATAIVSNDSCAPPDGSFYLTGVPADGSATYPIFTATVSRGAMSLSSATSYTDQWTYNTTDHRLYIANTTEGSAQQMVGLPVLFGDRWASNGRPYGDDGLLSLVFQGNCTAYLVMTGAETIYGWWGQPTTDDTLPIAMLWEGENGQANGAIRIGL